ncbi:hypothetical protein H6F74_24085 [Trichocoleus sp. FACHB-90]|uniref:hypothetical protein n=1 Tax=Cyanophyceae TaxID=3028117 RepID=UPI0016884C20|nr:hypothetical protein [Trichocoleus sp. FACHB-90]MBD1929295.1 hypothetical protein [Trichocoleus sp. FACHB-90]
MTLSRFAKAIAFELWRLQALTCKALARSAVKSQPCKDAIAFVSTSKSDTEASQRFSRVF